MTIAKKRSAENLKRSTSNHIVKDLVDLIDKYAKKDPKILKKLTKTLRNKLVKKAV